MVRGNGREVLGGPPLMDPGWAGDDRRIAALLPSVLATDYGCSLFATDPDGIVRLWSAGAAGLYGYQAPAVLGKLAWWDLCSPGPAGDQLPRAPLDAALRDGSWQGTLELASHGQPGMLRLTVTPLRAPGGRHLGFLTVSRDISAQRRQLEQLEDARFAARSLFEANAVALATADPLGVITDANHPAEVLTGRTRDELIGTQVTEYATEPERARAALREVLRTGQVSNREFTVRRPDGTTVSVLISASAVKGKDGKLHDLLATMLDLTEQRRMREQLLRSKAYHRGLLEAAADGLVVIDQAGLITDVTRQVSALSGFDRDELIGSSFAECCRDSEQARQLMEQSLAGDGASQAELHLLTRDDSVRQLSVSASVFRDPVGKEARLVASLRDITDQAALYERLAHERAYNRSIVEASANGIMISDLRRQITDVNGTMCELTGRRRENLIGAEMSGCFADPGAATDAIHRALLTGEVTNAELTLATREHTEVLVNISILRGESAAAGALLVSCRDVSGQARLQRDLAVQQEYTRAIFESSNVALFTIGHNGAVTDVNAAACEFTGYSRHRLLGRPFASLFTSQDAASAGLQQALRDGRVGGYELTLSPAGRPALPVNLNGGRFLDPRAGQESVIVAVRDISAEKATREELHRYRQSLYGATMDALVLTDTLGTITDVNHQMEVLTGRTRGNLIGTPVETCFTEPDRAHEFITTVLREGQAVDVELTVRRPDGGSTVLWYTAATFSGSQGKLQGIFASARDITERKRFEELQAGMLARAHELDRAKSDFVSRVSHELRSPLTSVLGYLELLRTDEPGPLTGVYESFTPSISNGQLTARLDVAPGMVLDADPGRLERVVVNLISNAVKFTPPGGQIDVSCRGEDGQVVIEVRDTGIGVPEEEQARLFTRFFRSSISREKETQGTGLGLYIVKHVVEAHGGMVTVRSVPGAGSTFTVRLPTHRLARAQQPEREGAG